MKLSRYVWLFWLGNFVLLAGFGAFLMNANSETRAQRGARNAAIANLKTDERRIDWKEDGAHTTFTVMDTMLSPRERPQEQPVIVKKDDPPLQREKTDEQLKSELQSELNRKFKLLRLALSSSDEYPTIAMVVADKVRLQWFEGMNLKEEYGRSQSMDLKRLAYDLKILSIDAEGVLVNAASFEKPSKRFDVRISMHEGSATTSMMSADYIPHGEALKLVPQPGSKPETILLPYEPDRQKAERYGYPIPKDEFDAETIDDFAKYTKSTDNGLQILPELPEDSPARKYGARGGEIIKTINGKPVKTMSDVRHEVRTQYDAGTREFKVGYEKDGIPNERTFTAPEK